MRKIIVYATLGVSVLAILYFIWDMFIRSSAPVPLVPAKNSDTINKEQVDTVKPKPVVSNIIKPVSKDTTWITYTVKSGDVLGKISSKFSIGVGLIRKKNNLKNDNISIGKTLTIPVKAEYPISSGDNLDAISKKFGIDKQAILRANGFKDEKSLVKGKSIYIPF